MAHIPGRSEPRSGCFAFHSEAIAGMRWQLADKAAEAQRPERRLSNRSRV
jgi:hypothetical protein